MKTKRWKNLAIVFALAALASAATASVPTLQRGAFAPAGSATALTNGDLSLQDIKGQAVIGEATGTGGGGTFTLQTGAVYSLAEEGTTLAASCELADTGQIIKTNIARSNNNLIITWDYGATAPAGVKVFSLAAPNQAYVADAAQFVDLTPTALAPTVKSYTDPGAGRNARNCYYRVVPWPLVAGTDLLDDRNNSITVGKVEINVPANQYDFISLPFMEDNYLLKDIIGDQLGDRAEYYFWNAATQRNPGATYGNSRWNGNDEGLNTKLRIGDGFYVRAKNAAPLTLVGRFGKMTLPVVRQLFPKNNYNLIAFPFPTAKALASLGLTLDPRADAYEWFNYTKYNSATYTGASPVSWSPAVGVETLQLNRPRFFRPVSSLDWTIDP
jgi:hypothetical protein